MEVKDEQRKNAPDRRVVDTAAFPLQGQDGEWVITDRRQGVCRRLDDSIAVQKGLITPILSTGLLMLVVFWILTRSGITEMPGWLPFWILYPEILIEHLL